MERLGISIYPEHSTREKDIAYIRMAGKYGFKRIFTCLLSAGEKSKEELVDEFRTLIDRRDKMSLEQEIIKKVEEIENQMIADLQALVRIDSIEQKAQPDAPFGEGIRLALDKALEISEKLGFATKNMENYIGYAQYGQGEDYVCAIGHVDVVPVGDGWKYPPFSGHLEDGVIYSRGVLDNKGPILSCLYGLYALKELGVQPKHPVRIIFGCDEESGFEDLTYYLEREKPPLYGFTPDCKYPVVYSERGRAIVKIKGEMKQIDTFFEFVNNYFIGAKK